MSEMDNPRNDSGGIAADILRIYRVHTTEMPSAELDQRVLAMAAAAAVVPAASRRRPGWLRYAASVAVVVVSAGLSWRMLQDGPSPGRGAERTQTMESPQAMPRVQQSPAPTPATGGASVTGSPAAAAPLEQAGRGMEPSTARAERQMSQDALHESAPPAAPPPPAFSPPAQPAPLAKAKPATGESSHHAPSGLAATNSMREAAAPAEAADSMTGVPTPSTALSKGAATSPLDPAVWFEHVRALRDSGHLDEARVSLRELQLRYPQLAIPADLQALRSLPATPPSAD